MIVISIPTLIIIDDQIILVHLKNYIIKYTFDIDANICPDAVIKLYAKFQAINTENINTPVTTITLNDVQPYDEPITAVADLHADIQCVNKRVAEIHKSYTLRFISVYAIDVLPYDF